MFESWGTEHGYKLYLGTINLCSPSPLVLPRRFERIGEHSELIKPEWRRNTPGFDPRLYRARVELVTLGVNGWVYRWSDEEHRGSFVQDNEACKADCLAEFVTEVNLSDHLPPKGPIVLDLGSTHDWGLGINGPWR